MRIWLSAFYRYLMCTNWLFGVFSIWWTHYSGKISITRHILVPFFSLILQFWTTSNIRLKIAAAVAFRRIRTDSFVRKDIIVSLFLPSGNAIQTTAHWLMWSIHSVTYAFYQWPIDLYSYRSVCYLWSLQLTVECNWQDTANNFVSSEDHRSKQKRSCQFPRPWKWK